MGVLEQTRFGDWTEYGYASFYKRYVRSLEAIAHKQFRTTGEEARTLAHGFVAEQICAPSGGVLATFDPARRFRPYLVTAFYHYCIRETSTRTSTSLDFDPVAPATYQPEWGTLSEEAETLRCRVRKAIHIARQDLLEHGRLEEAERRYLEIKWPEDLKALPYSDRQIGEQLKAEQLLSAETAGAQTRAACRLGERVGRKLLFNLRRLLRDEYQRHLPEGEADEATTMSLKTVVHVLGLEEESL